MNTRLRRGRAGGGDATIDLGTADAGTPDEPTPDDGLPGRSADPRKGSAVVSSGPSDPARNAAGPPASQRTSAAATWMAVGSLAAAVVLWVVVVATFDAQTVGPLGLIDAIDPMFFAAVALLALSFALALVFAPRRSLLTIQIAALLSMLYATPVLTEQYARFPVTWLHVGFADHIGATGQALPLVDARFSWPGFFAAFGLIAEAAGLDSTLPLVRWAPIATNVGALLCIALLAGRASRQPRAAWLALWIFCFANWPGQDYFAPQAVNYFLYLVAIVIVVRFFGPMQAPASARSSGRLARVSAMLRRLVPDERTEPEPTTQTQRVGLLLVLVALIATVAVSHQLTPVMLTSGLAALVVSGRCRLPTLPVLAGVCFFAWFTLGAEEFWAGWLGELVGQFGAVDRSLEQNIVARVVGDDARLLVVRARLAFSVIVAVVATVGFVRRARAGYGELGLALLGLSPLVVLLANSYGGEALIRAYFFALPFMAVFAAFTVFPSAATRAGWGVVAGVTLCSAVAGPLLMLTRYGNESFEMVTANDVAAMEYVYDHAPPGSTVVAPTNQPAWQYRRVGDLHHRYIEPDRINDSEVVAELMRDAPGHSYLVVTPNQEAWGQLHGGYEEGWTQRLVKKLVAEGGYRRVFRQGDAQVIQRRPR